MTTQQKLDGLLRYAAGISTYNGDRVWLDQKVDDLMEKFGFLDRDDIVYFLQELEQRGLVTTMISGGGTGVSVTMEGYLRLEEPRDEGDDDQVLGAKSF